MAVIIDNKGDVTKVSKPKIKKPKVSQEKIQPKVDSDGVTYYPIRKETLMSGGCIYKEFPDVIWFREILYKDMVKLSKLKYTINIDNLLLDVLNDMIVDFDASVLDGSDARYIVAYIRSLSLTDPNYYMRYTCSCGIVNPFAFNVGELNNTRLEDFDLSLLDPIDILGEPFTLAFPNLTRTAEGEDLINGYDYEQDEDLIRFISDVRFASLISSIDGVVYSVKETMDILGNLPFNEVMKLGGVLSKFPTFGFGNKLKRVCRECKKESSVKISFREIFFFPTDK